MNNSLLKQGALLIVYILCTVNQIHADPAVNKTEVRIGATLSLTGKLSFSGLAQQAGLQQAVNEINEAGGISGKSLKLLIEDNAGDPKTAVNSVNKLIRVDKIDFLYSPFSHITQAIKETVRKAGILMIYAASLGEVAKESPLFFRDWGDATSQGRTLVKALLASNYKKAAFISEISEGCLEIQKGFTESAAANGISIVSEETYAPGETDFKPILLKTSVKKPEAIVTCTWRDGSLLMPQLKTLGMINIPTFQYLAPFIPASDTPDIRKLYEENNTVAVWLGFIEGALTPEQKHFFTKMQNLYNQQPRIESALAYDNVQILSNAYKSCLPDYKADCVSKALLKTDYSGIAGHLSFDTDGRSNRPDLLIKVKNSIWISAF